MQKSQNIRPYRQPSHRPRSLSPMIGLISQTQLTEPSEVLNKAYIVPKFKNISLAYPLNPESKPEESRSSLSQKISLLEKSRKFDLLKIEQLERQVKDLSDQLEAMKKANKSLLEDKGFASSELHSLYQTLFITDMKQQMTDMNNNVTKFRHEKEQIKNSFEALKKENGQLQASIKRYRMLLAKGLKKQGKDSETNEDGSSVFSSAISEGERTPSRFELAGRGGSSHNIHPTVKLNSVSLSRIEKLNLVIIQLNNCTNMNQLCKIMTRAAKSLTKSEKVSIYIVDNKAREQYVKSFTGSADFIGRVRMGNTWVLMHTHKEAYQDEPLFKKLEDLKFPVRQAELLIIPVVHNREINFVIQSQEKKTQDAKLRIYTPLDEILLKIVANAVALKIESLYAYEQEKIELKHSSQVANISAKIISCLTHRDIANRVRSVLPQFFDFENAGIVFIDNKAHQFYVMIHDPSADDYFGEGYLRFPFGIGLTGQAMSRDEVTVFHNPKTIPIYNPEIDNVGWVHETKCIMMGCLKDWNGNINGVIQLTNKKYDDVGPKDVKRLEGFLELLGTCVGSTNLAVEQYSITIKFKTIMENIMKIVADSDKAVLDVELNTVVSQMTNLKNSFNDWFKNRKK